MGVKGRRYKLWWSGNSDDTGGVGVLVKEELCEKVVEVQRKSNRMMTVVIALEEEVVWPVFAFNILVWSATMEVIEGPLSSSMVMF